MSTITLTFPRPHSGQRAILTGASRFNAVACGRRFGKTTLGIHRLSVPALKGFPVGWFAPTYKYLIDAWRQFVRVLGPAIRRKNENERTIELATGGRIEFWSLDDPDAGRSRRYAAAVVDEAAKVAKLEQAWNEAIRPTLADFGGSADLYSTPKGRDFFWRLFTRGHDPAEPEWSSFCFPTASNPHIQPGEIEALRRQLPDRAFRQEILAEFIEDSGGVFRLVDESVDRGRTLNAEPADGAAYHLGVDLARVEDFTVLCVLDGSGKQVYHERFNQISWERQIAAIDAVARRYRAPITVDSTGVGDPIYERVRALGHRVSPYGFTSTSKEALIDHLAMAIEQGRMRLMDVPVQTAELQAYEYQVTPSRNVRMNAPEGMHDDTVIALALAAWSALGGGTRRVRFA